MWPRLGQFRVSRWRVLASISFVTMRISGRELQGARRLQGSCIAVQGLQRQLASFDLDCITFLGKAAGLRMTGGGG